MSLGDLEASLAINMTIKKIGAAEKNIEEILRRDPENLYAILMKAYIRSESGNAGEALAAYEKAFPLAGGHPEIERALLDTISRLALKTSRYFDARRYARLNLEFFGENVASRLIIALSSLMLDDDRCFEENMDIALETGVFGPAFQVNWEDLFDDQTTFQKLYERILSYRSGYELRFLEKKWM